MKYSKNKQIRHILPFVISAAVALHGIVRSQAQEEAANASAQASNQIDTWRTAAENGEAWAAFNLALSYHSGHGVPKGETDALYWYRFAADKGYAAAQANLGYCYETGFGVVIDYAEAVRWYQRAAAQGHPYAQYNLGKKYQTGPGVATDPKLAEKWLLQAAQRNFVPAYFSLGQLYATGVSGQKDYKRAYEWFRLAADQGYPAAQHAIGYMHFSGLTGETDYFEAIKWFRLAASRNFADSHFNLAYCYERGLGAPQNLIAAVSQYRIAAEFGHPSAQYSLGVAYYEGRGVEVDFIRAYKWWNLAAAAGIVEAASSKEILRGLMNKEQIDEAQKLASEFVPRVSEKTDTPKLVLAPAVDISQIERVASGFFVSTNGYLFTTFRAISGASKIQVITEGGRFDATVAKIAQTSDMALLKIEGNAGALALTLSRNGPIGSDILLLGFAEENQGEFSPKSARGTVFEFLGYQADPRQISIEPKVTPPFAGTAAINSSGQVVGMVLLPPDDSTPRAENDQTARTPVTYAAKSDYLISFLESIPEVTPTIESSLGPELTDAELMSRARAATALILVLRAQE